MTQTEFMARVREMWRTRPQRTPWNSPLAGVTTGIGYRYDIDPILVRVAFVAATIFGGAGVPLYLAAWLTFPRAGDQAAALESVLGRGRSSESRKKTVVLIIAFAIAFMAFAPFGVGMGGSGIMSLALMLVGWWLLHQRRPNPPEPMQVPTSAAQQTTVGQTPPSWDPLGAAPFAWDLPEPTPHAPAPEPLPRSRFNKVVIGLAIVLGAIAAALNAAGVDWFTPTRIAAVALTTVGIGLLAGSFLKRGYGLLFVAIPLAVFVAASSGAGAIHVNPTGEQVWAVSSLSSLQPNYRVEGGSGTLDLRKLDLSSDRKVDVNVRFGQVRVLLPAGMNVRNNCDVQFGDARCLHGDIDGGNDGTSGPVLTLNINDRFGDVEVVRD